MSMASVFEDLGKKIAQTGQSVMRAARGFTDAAKLNTQIAEERKLVQSLYQQLGQRYYELEGASPKSELSPACESINAANRRIEALEDELRRASEAQSAHGAQSSQEASDKDGYKGE